VAAAGALDVHAAAMRFDEFADDREAEAQAAVRPGGRVVRLPEAIEDVRQQLGRDARARVADADLDDVAVGPDVEADAPTARR
jgi:hypothetical protein